MYEELATPTKILPGLWVAGSRWPYPTDLNVDLLVTLCERHEIFYSPPAGREISLPMRDTSTDGATDDQIRDLAHEVAEAVFDGQGVLVRCHWGIERSAMVAILALRELIDAPFSEALAHMRALRPRHVLPNPRAAAWSVASGRLAPTATW